MKKYRLLKDLPGVSLGVTLEWKDSIEKYRLEYAGLHLESAYYAFTRTEIETYQDWFEEIKEPNYHSYFYINDCLEIVKKEWPILKEREEFLRIEAGNCFETRFNAEQALRDFKHSLDYYGKKEIK